jgi:transposase
VGVLIDHSNGRVLEVLESREKAAVVAWLEKAREAGTLGSLEEVTCDMWDGYVEAVKQVFGTAVRLTIDRFHVIKNFQEALNKARREIQKSLPREAAKELKGSRWLWVSNPETLSEEQRQELERLKGRFPELRRLAEHREALRNIFEDRTITTAAEGAAKLQEWCRRGRELGLGALETFNRTLENWMDKIANYFVARSSNGRTEGFNHGLRSILWRAFGMRNFSHFRLRVLHVFG